MFRIISYCYYYSFSYTCLNEIIGIDQHREEEIGDVERIKKSCDDDELVNLSDLFEKYTNDVVCRVTFGKKYSEGESGSRFRLMLDEFFEVFGGVNLEDVVPWLAWVDRIRGFKGKVDRVARDMDDFFDGLVEERRTMGGGGGR
ncbi:hypothetical protein R6Q57_000353 [Mikania cordata]